MTNFKADCAKIAMLAMVIGGILLLIFFPEARR